MDREITIDQSERAPAAEVLQRLIQQLFRDGTHHAGFLRDREEFAGRNQPVVGTFPPNQQLGAE